MAGSVLPIGLARRPTVTKDRILDAAESLFMEHGFEATSLRAITAAAGVNLASVNYHFGSKEELFQAVLTRRLDPMNQERLDLLTRLERESEPAPLSVRSHPVGDVRAGVRLARDPERGGKNFLRLLGRAYADPAPFIRKFLAEQYATMIERFKSAFGRALPELPKKELSWRLHFIMGALSYTLAGTDALAPHRGAHAGGDRQRRGAAAPSRPVPARGLQSPAPMAPGTSCVAPGRESRCSPSSGSSPCWSPRWCSPMSMPRALVFTAAFAVALGVAWVAHTLPGWAALAVDDRCSCCSRSRRTCRR